MRAGVIYPISKWLYLMVLFAGALTVLAFAPFSITPLAWLMPAVLFYALTKANSRKQHLLLGWSFGIGLFGAGASWIFTAMYTFADAPLALAILGTLLFVTIIAFLTMGLFGLLTSYYRDKPIFARLLLFYPSAWVVMEWFRSWFLTGFPWLYLGNSQIDTFLAAYAPITGVLGVSLACVLISGGVLSFLFGNSLKRTVQIPFDPNNALVSKKVITEEKYGATVRIISALIIVVIASIAFALQGIDWTKKAGEPIKVSVLQSNISQSDKLDRDRTLQSSINLYKKMTLKSKDFHKSDLIVWPETGLFDTFNNHMDSLILPLQKSLFNSKKAILIGGFNVNQNNEIENSVLAISENSREIYSKRHLVPFGEYIPLLDYIRWLGRWIQLPYSNIAPGKNSGTLNVVGQTAQMSICYEDAFGSEIIQSLPEASMLINVTHDGWFTGSLEPEQHMQIARMRSLETGRYMVRATTTGPSGIINEKGKVIVTAPINMKKIITGKVHPFKGATPYVRWGNWLIVSILSAILLLGLIGRKNDE